MIRKIGLAAAILAIGLSACAGALAEGSLEGTAWKLISYGGNPVLPGSEPSLSFENGQLGGNATCNTFGGDYQITGDKIIFGELFWTLMACMDEDLMAQEQAYMQILGGDMRYEIVDGQLFLQSANDQVLVFEPLN